MILTKETCNPSIEVSGCFLLFEDTFLLLKRVTENIWGVPAGKCEPGESTIEAMRRELFEETGVEIIQSKIIFEKIYYCRHGEKDLSYTLFSIYLNAKPKVLLNDEHTEYKWVRPVEALQMNLIEDEEVCIADFFHTPIK